MIDSHSALCMEGELPVKEFKLLMCKLLSNEFLNFKLRLFTVQAAFATMCYFLMCAAPNRYRSF